MEPTNTGLIVAGLIFVAVYILFDRVSAMFIAKSHDEAEVEKTKVLGDVFESMGDKLVATMQLMHGGLAGDAVRRMTGMTIDPDGRREEANGRSTVQYQRGDNGQHRATAPVPSDFPEATTAQGR